MMESLAERRMQWEEDAIGIDDSGVEDEQDDDEEDDEDLDEEDDEDVSLRRVIIPSS